MMQISDAEGRSSSVWASWGKGVRLASIPGKSMIPDSCQVRSILVVNRYEVTVDSIIIYCWNETVISKLLVCVQSSGYGSVTASTDTINWHVGLW